MLDLLEDLVEDSRGDDEAALLGEEEVVVVVRDGGDGVERADHVHDLKGVGGVLAVSVSHPHLRTPIVLEALAAGADEVPASLLHDSHRVWQVSGVSAVSDCPCVRRDLDLGVLRRGHDLIAVLMIAVLVLVLPLGDDAD